MSKYFITWEADMSRFPVDPKERAQSLGPMIEMGQQDIKEGKTISWGAFIGGGRGYTIGEGNAVELYASLQRWAPYISFQVQEVLSVEEVAEAAKAMAG